MTNWNDQGRNHGRFLGGANGVAEGMIVLLDDVAAMKTATDPRSRTLFKAICQWAARTGGAGKCAVCHTEFEPGRHRLGAFYVVTPVAKTSSGLVALAPVCLTCCSRADFGDRIVDVFKEVIFPPGTTADRILE